MTSDVLSGRALSRATLARQLLLDRHDLATEEAIEHLVGMQAQSPNAPYVALWTRLHSFDTDDLAARLSNRRVVRTTLMRGTIHLVTARDCLALRPLIQAVCERSFANSWFNKRLVGVDLDAVVAVGRALLEQRPGTRAELRNLLGERWPEFDADSLAYAITYLLPLVQVPPRGIWGTTGPAAFTPTEHWLRQPLPPSPPPDETVLRYLGAFGPATVPDVQTWSGLTRLREVVERLRPQLRTFRDDGGAELFDLPAAPRPDADTPAPPRFLPEFDNVLLSHGDRSRVIENRRRVPLPATNGGVTGTVLIDGFFRATWKISRRRDTATLSVQPFQPLSDADRDEVAEEGARLLAFAAADCEHHDVQIN